MTEGLWSSSDMLQQQGWALDTPAQCFCLVSGSHRLKPLIKTDSGPYKSLGQTQTAMGPHSSWSALENKQGLELD